MKVKVGVLGSALGCVQRVHTSICGESGYDFEFILLPLQKVGYPNRT